ncbi:hypothetical protein GDO78_004983 [Eleutherodactylus coqui]|uniref:Uncharacterized protein n=1 Tax=Eleutherodactylus coqui TaxID=57060 RepID=A0A8J6FIR6_ELECQ|nr:hypothetical protein GDO78_004983 [Eleutherodactylus coqui]
MAIVSPGHFWRGEAIAQESPITPDSGRWERGNYIYLGKNQLSAFVLPRQKHAQKTSLMCAFIKRPSSRRLYIRYTLRLIYTQRQPFK